jgi:myo-inositol-1-phosphate synthase
MTRPTPAAPGRVGAWLVGARGSISTCVTYGLAGLRSGLLEPIGLCTERGPLREMPLVPLDGLVLGGHDVCGRGLHASAIELVRQGILKEELVEKVRSEVAEVASRIRTGTLDDHDRASPGFEASAQKLGAAPPREQIAKIADDIQAFRSAEGLDAVVVVNLASTEAVRPEQAEWSSLDRFESALDGARAQPASLLYAYAAFAAGCPYVNFTPSLGASSPALRELAVRQGMPHCGNDGKTGETLVKTVLAPMFTARNLRVLAWQGYNMLGNRDGEVLVDGAHRQAKLRNKDEALRSLLGDEGLHTRVGIDFVPSLQDWKTAWDFVHFEGFLGTRMSLQFTWTGSDSALAAPLVLDLVRLAELARRSGEVGEMAHTASFFKAPIAGGTHDFRAQFQSLLDYARTRSASPGDLHRRAGRSPEEAHGQAGSA